MPRPGTRDCSVAHLLAQMDRFSRCSSTADCKRKQKRHHQKAKAPPAENRRKTVLWNNMHRLNRRTDCHEGGNVYRVCTIAINVIAFLSLIADTAAAGDKGCTLRGKAEYAARDRVFGGENSRAAGMPPGGLWPVTPRRTPAFLHVVRQGVSAALSHRRCLTAACTSPAAFSPTVFHGQCHDCHLPQSQFFANLRH